MTSYQLPITDNLRKYRVDITLGLLLFIISIIIKLPYLGSYLTVDEPRWIRGGGQFLMALRSGDLAQTYWHFHPGITLVWGEAIILWLQSWWATQPTLQAFVEFQMEHLSQSVGPLRLSGVVLTSLAVPLVYGLSRPLIERRSALLGVALLAFDPFFVAHSRIINGDALAGILMVAAYLSFALLLLKPSLKIAALSGLLAGLAFLTKLPSQILVPLIGLLAIIGYFNDKQWQFWLKALLVSSLTATAVFFLLWPAMWVTPVETLQRMFEDTFVVGDIGGKDKAEFFMGQIREQQSLYFYPLALLFRLTPVNLIGAILSLGVLFIKDSRIRRAVLLLWFFAIIVVLLANVSPKKADRYAMSVVLALDLLAGIGWIGLSIWANQFKIQNSKFKIIPSLITILIMGQIAFVVFNYPYLLTYYNPLLGGYAKAVELVPVGWGEGLDQAAAWINHQPDAQSATISPYYENVTNHYLAGRSLDWSKDGKKQVQADYVVFYIAQTQRDLPYPGLVDYFENKQPAHIIRQGETPYIWIYKREQPLRQLDGEAEIIGRAQIVGYDRSAANLESGGSTNITLYLLTQDQQLPANEDFWVSLVDTGGNGHGAWQSDANNLWTPNAIVEWRGKLSLPADISPGDYRLRVSLVDTNTGAEVTHFPFEEEVVSVGDISD